MTILAFFKRLFGGKPRLRFNAPDDIATMMREALAVAEMRLSAYYKRPIKFGTGTLSYQEHHTPVHRNGDFYVVGSDGLDRSFWATYNQNNRHGIVHAAVGLDGKRSRSHGPKMFIHEQAHILILRHRLIDGYNYAEQHRVMKAAGIGFPWE